MLASRWPHVQVPEFQGLPASTIESLALVLTERVFAPKAVIYYQGSEVDDVYFVQRGTVTVRPPTHLTLSPLHCQTCMLQGLT